MENKWQFGSGSSSSSSTSSSSASSSTTSASSSNPFFASVLGPSSTGLNKDSTNSGILRSLVKQDFREQNGNARYGNPDYSTSRNRGENGGTYNKEKVSSVHYQHERVEPCYFSSSIYYGGQEVYVPSSQQTNTTSQHIYKKAEGNDDANGSHIKEEASRGNWWEGSLYY